MITYAYCIRSFCDEIDEAAAYAFVEARLWPNGPICPHCGGVEHISKMQGKSTRIGTYKCYQCRKPFTVKVGTVFEASHVPIQLHRTLGCTLKTAWFISHRIRLAMATVGVEPLGGPGTIVEIDETYIGRQEGQPAKSGAATKNIVLTLVERGGISRSFHIDSTSIADIAPILRANIHPETSIMTDEARQYVEVGKEFGSHGAVNHSADEYVRGQISPTPLRPSTASLNAV
jgi:transposase-like protein